MKTSIIIDIGNSFFKAAAFEQGRIIRTFRDRINDVEGIEESLVKLTALHPQRALLSSVANKKGMVEKYLEKVQMPYIALTAQTPVPLVNRYETPTTLGQDRLANAVAAAHTFKGEPVLVIDAGTCIKFDFVNASGEYLGGSIAPGIDMRFKALQHFTAKLPLVKRTEQIFLLGKNTEESILSGVINGAMAEVKGMVEQYQILFKNLRIVLTGGDIHILERNIKTTIVADPYFTIKGLYEILQHQPN